jgi:uncharacterized protein (TIGR00255 family)
MIRSMTGYGEAEHQTPAGRLRAEVRTVNHRFFSANLRMGRGLERFEPQVREWLRVHLPRGHAHCSVRLESDGEPAEGTGLRIDADRARQYVEALRDLKQKLGLAGDVDLSILTRFSDILAWDEEIGAAIEAEDVQQVTEAAARATVLMREEEGRRLADDLEERLRGIENAIVMVGARAPQRLVVERDRMRRVVSELLEGIPLDEERVHREIAMLAERWDVSEELVRLRSHIDLFRSTLRSAEPVGKRLSFLIQEMNREANTIGSKANDAEIEHSVIAIKDEIERLREQVENVE